MARLAVTSPAAMMDSGALRDWVRESNGRGDLWFVPGMDELATRLGG
jgi:hypothetical protein